MTTVTGRISHSEDGEAIQLPEEIAFGRELEVSIVRTGDVLTIYPKRMPLKEMLRKLSELPAPGYIGVRDTDTLPERPGL